METKAFTKSKNYCFYSLTHVIFTLQPPKTITQTLMTHFSPLHFRSFSFFFALHSYIFRTPQRLKCSLSSLDDDSTNSLRLPLWDQASAEFCFAKSRELLTKPFLTPRPPHNSCRDLRDTVQIPRQNVVLESRFQDLNPGLPGGGAYFPQNDRNTLTKSESMSRKTYSNIPRQLERNRSFIHNNRNNYDLKHRTTADFFDPLSPFPIYDTAYVFEPAYDNPFLYRTEVYAPKEPLPPPRDLNPFRQRTLSFSDGQEPPAPPKKSGRSIRDRNRRRQSYNPKAYEESSSSESECASLGSAEIDWRRRRRLSGSNGSIRSDVGRRAFSNLLRPDSGSGKMLLGRSPPPSNTILSGLSPTSAARCQRASDDTSSDSSL